MPKRLAVALCLLALPACSLLRLGTQPLPSTAAAASPSALPSARPSSSPSPLASLAPTPAADLNDVTAQKAAMLPAFAGDVERFPLATRYWIEVNVEFDPQAQTARLTGVERLRFTNPLPGDLNDLVLMLWPNDPQYDSSMTAGPAVIDGVAAAGTAELGRLALRFQLPRTLPPGRSVDVSLPFQVQAGGPIGGATPKRFGSTQGVLAAPTFYPLVPRLVDGRWQVEAAPPGGDTTNSDIALYQLRLTVPADLALAASGREVDSRANPDGTRTVTLVSGPARDLAFVLGPFERTVRQVDGVAVNIWVLPEHHGDAAAVADAAAAQVRTLDRLVGPYPYAELDVADVPGAFGGIEYPELVFVGTIGGHDQIIPTVHEVAHQWFYALIGDDQLHEPWLDEAAATFAEVLYYEGQGREATATGMLSDFRSYLRSYPGRTRPIGLGVGDYGSEDAYGLIVYVKGALFFDALRERMGTAAFGEFLHAYFQAYRYAFATAHDFQTSAEHACTCDLKDLFNLWVYQGGPLPGP